MLSTIVISSPRDGAYFSVRLKVIPLAVKPSVTTGTSLVDFSTASMPPLPGLRLTLPPLPSRPAPMPWPLSTIVPVPPLDCTTATLALGVVTGVALVKVMLPVCVLSPKAIVPPGAVSICANSVLLRLMPAPGLPLPMFMGSEGSDSRITTACTEGNSVLANSLTVVPVPYGPLLTTNRSPLASRARTVGPETPLSVAVGVVAPGANMLTVVPPRP